MAKPAPNPQLCCKRNPITLAVSPRFSSPAPMGNPLACNLQVNATRESPPRLCLQIASEPLPRLPARFHHCDDDGGNSSPKNRQPLTCGRWHGDSGNPPLYHATLCHLPPKTPKRDKGTLPCNFVPFPAFRWQPCNMPHSATIFRGGCHYLSRGLPPTTCHYLQSLRLPTIPP